MTDQPNTDAPKEYKLLLEFIFKNKGRRGVVKHQYPIQGILLYYGIRIKNVGDLPFPGGSVSNLEIKHDNHSVAIKSSDTKPVKALAPGEAADIWIVNTIINIPGPIWVSCNISPKMLIDKIHSYQCSRGQKNIVPLAGINKWSHSDYVQPHMEFLQSRTNFLIAVLTIVAVVDGVFGLGNIASGLWSLITCLYDSVIQWVANINS